MDGKNFLDISKLGLSENRVSQAQRLLTQTDKSKNLHELAHGQTEQKKAEQAGTDFEALILQQMFGTMWQSSSEGGLFDGGYESDMYKGFLIESVAKETAAHSSTGLKDMIIKDMQKTENSVVSKRLNTKG